MNASGPLASMDSMSLNVNGNGNHQPNTTISPANSFDPTRDNKPNLSLVREFNNITVLSDFGRRGNMTGGKPFKRAYRACVYCRKKKVKCDLGDISNPSPPPCARCKRENKECILGESKRGGIANVKAGREKRRRLVDGSEQSVSPSVSPGVSVGGSPRRSDSSRQATQEALAMRLPPNFSTTELHNTSDALDILAHAARSFPRLSRSRMADQLAHEQQRQPAEENNNNQLEQSQSHRETSDPKLEMLMRLEDTELVKDVHLTVAQIKLLVAFFFKHMHPFYPYIPREIQALEQLADMPFLLTAIITLASRYYEHKPTDGGDVEKHFAHQAIEEIHEKCWELCQRQFANTVWAEASTRSIGTVFVFMLFSEWNPRAIHVRMSDYANRVASSESGKPPGGDNTTALGAFRRSDRMSWMLIGNSIRLAQDMGFMDTNPKVYVATHLSEITLAQRLGRRAMLGDFLREPINPRLKFTPVEEAKLEIVRLLALAQDTLYASRETTRELVKDGKYLSFLGFFTPHLDFWERKHESLFSTPGIDRESLLSDYHYARLYIYSLALSEDDTRGSLLSNIPAARYVGMATDAARELIFSTQRVHKMETTPLKMAPIRWLVRVVHAAVFLLKSVLLVPASAFDSYHQFLVDIVKDLSHTIIEASPDEVHLSGRYGKVLLAMCSQITNTDEAAAVAGPGPGPDHQTTQHDTGRNPRSYNNSNRDYNGNMGLDTAQSGQQETQLGSASGSGSVPVSSHVQKAHTVDQFDSSVGANSHNIHGNANVNSEHSNILSLMDMNFDFFMEGTEGLGFVEPFMEDIEQQEWFQRNAM